jgi:hypothetical protein
MFLAIERKFHYLAAGFGHVSSHNIPVNVLDGADVCVRCWRDQGVNGRSTSRQREQQPAGIDY